MNYHGFAFPVKGFLVDGVQDPEAFAEMIRERREEYESTVQYALQNLIDSHDTDRLASMIVNGNKHPYHDESRWDYDIGERVSPRHYDGYIVSAPNEQEREIQRLVALFQMTYLGAPMIYYGTEAGMWGADDPDDRKPMVWRDLRYDAEALDPLGRPRTADPVAFDEALYAYYRDVIALRRDTDALRRGDVVPLMADSERHSLAYVRTLGEEVVVVVINRSDEAHSMRIELPEALRGQYEERFATLPDEARRVQQDQTALLLELPARGGIVLTRTGAGGS